MLNIPIKAKHTVEFERNHYQEILARSYRLLFLKLIKDSNLFTPAVAEIYANELKERDEDIHQFYLHPNEYTVHLSYVWHLDKLSDARIHVLFPNLISLLAGPMGIINQAHFLEEEDHPSNPLPISKEDVSKIRSLMNSYISKLSESSVGSNFSCC